MSYSILIFCDLEFLQCLAVLLDHAIYSLDTGHFGEI